MGLFNRNIKEEDLPILPKLPELPTLPNMNSFENPEEEPGEIYKLPSFPTNSFGEKFSQNTIKNAVSGREDFENELPPAKNMGKMIPLNPIEPPKMGSPTMQPIYTESISPSYKRRAISAEPIFIRIDKFEESLNIFDDIKEKIKEMEVLLGETKALKKKEEDELSLWEMEIQRLKKQIEKVDRDIFSKIE